MPRWKMSKGILEFNLPEEREEHQVAVNASAYRSALSSLDVYLRSQIKYAPDDTPKEVIEALQAVRDKLHEELDGLPL